MYRDVIEVSTTPGERIDITDKVADAIKKSGIRDGLCSVFVKGTTAALLLNEDDRMLHADMERALEKIAPADKVYSHPRNAHSHIRAALLRNSVDVPVADGGLLLGTWQSVMLWEFDVEGRKRTVVVTLIGL